MNPSESPRGTDSPSPDPVALFPSPPPDAEPAAAPFAMPPFLWGSANLTAAARRRLPGYGTAAGELGKAIWAYLEVLEIDPDNHSAWRQVGQVATAVRVFDQVAVGRRWRDRLRAYAGFSDDSGWLTGWWTVALMLVLVALAFLVG